MIGRGSSHLPYDQPWTPLLPYESPWITLFTIRAAMDLLDAYETWTFLSPYVPPWSLRRPCTSPLPYQPPWTLPLPIALRVAVDLAIAVELPFALQVAVRGTVENLSVRRGPLRYRTSRSGLFC